MHNLATKKDYFIVSGLGIGFGLLLIPILANIKPAFWTPTFANAVLLILFFGGVANFALWIGSLFGGMFHFLWQFTKFGAVGSFNGALDFGILNLLSFIFKIYSGPLLAIFNIIAVTCAMTNSYFLNKFWSFQKKGPLDIKEFGKFVGISIATIILNTLMVYFLTTHISVPDSLSKEIWENIAKIAALPITLLINFCGYKFIVFK